MLDIRVIRENPEKVNELLKKAVESVFNVLGSFVEE